MNEKEKRVYVIFIDDIPSGKEFQDLTDEEIIKICEKTGFIWSSFERFVYSYNNDYSLQLDSNYSYIKII